jgi:hypothetical protein
VRAPPAALKTPLLAALTAPTDGGTDETSTGPADAAGDPTTATTRDADGDTTTDLATGEDDLVSTHDDLVTGEDDLVSTADDVVAGAAGSPFSGSDDVVFEHADAVGFDSDAVIFIPQTARYSDDLRPEDRNSAHSSCCCHGTPESSTAHGTSTLEDTNRTGDIGSAEASGGPEPPDGPTWAGKPQEAGGSQKTGSPQPAGRSPMAAGPGTGRHRSPNGSTGGDTASGGTASDGTAGSSTVGGSTVGGSTVGSSTAGGGAVAPCCCSAPGGPRAGSTGTGESGVRANINVTISLETLLGLNEEPGSLEGTEPITAVEARRLAFQAGSTWRRLVTDPLSGTLLDYGRTRYTPPVPLADHSRARDVTCTGVHCDRPAALCDLDHTDEYPNGATSEVNLHSLCRRDHRFKHEGRWRHEVVDDPAYPKGTIRITSPTGHVYLSHPPAIGPITPDQDQNRNQDEGKGKVEDGKDAGEGKDKHQSEDGSGAPKGGPVPPIDNGPPPF